jgi:hypothetical protein
VVFELRGEAKIRACFVAALFLQGCAPWRVSAAGEPGAAQAEVRVNDSLYRRNLQDDSFVRREFQPRERGLRARIVRAQADSRIPAPPDAVVLLVLYRVPETGDATARWQLDVDSIDRDGKLRTVPIELRDPPLDPRETERVIPSPDVKIPAGLVSVGAFWVDLTPLVQASLLQPGQKARVRYDSYSATVPVTY